MKDKRTSKVAYDRYYQLIGENVFIHGGLSEILTRKNKRNGNEIRKSLSIEKDNQNLIGLQNEKIDLSIVVHVQKSNFKNQDVDNIAKVVLDALKKPKIDDGLPYLFKDDNQVIRLLIYKMKREEIKDFNTCQISISARKHDPKKEMNLIFV